MKPYPSIPELWHRIVHRASMDYPQSRNVTTSDFIRRELAKHGLAPTHERWGVEFTSAGGERVVVAVLSEDAAIVAREELKKRRRSPIVRRWYETDMIGVPYDGYDRELLLRYGTSTAESRNADAPSPGCDKWSNAYDLHARLVALGVRD